MKDKNKKGFTLVELLAAVIVLIVIIFLAISKIRETQLKAQYKAMKANAVSYINAVNDLASVDSLTSSRMHTGTFGKYVLKSYGIKLSGTEPDSASIKTRNFEVEYACLSYGIYKIIYQNNDYSQPVKGKCETGDEMLFAYTGYEQQFVVPFDGVYKIEAWGASGGQATSYEGSEVLTGGVGGYSVGEIELKKDQVLYINVGGKGTDDFYPYSGEGSTPGGYNGGGTAYGQYGSEPVYRVTSGSGGGATSVSLRSGLLKDLANYTDNVIIVAGGGGGATSHRYNNSSNYWRGTGGNAGGFTSVSGREYGRSRVPTSATYTSGGCGYDNNGSRGCAGFGQGQNASWSGGGGGGYYGGGASVHSATSGGSSYIGNFLLYSKVMYCKGCTKSDNTDTKTETTTCSSSDPKSNCTKQGDGYVKISVVNNDKNNGKYYFAYQNKEEEFVAPKTGKYKLEVWGAQGGSYSKTGGYGAYAIGYVDLQENDKLYINVGGTTTSTAGGYNGGGTAGTNYNARGGGGATSITLSHGLLSTFSENQSQVVIVAAGGGGSDKYEGGSDGGAAGGISGMPGGYYRKEGEAEFTVATGGTQTEGGLGATGAGNGTDGTFGLGGSHFSNHGGGGGGGFYGGGGGSYNSAVVGSGAGGSSYIGYSLLSNKAMYCYNCDESTSSLTKTVSTDCSNIVPTQNCSKKGNGYAIISLVE